MKIRTTLVLSCAAGATLGLGSVARAQELITVSYGWVEVVAGTSVLVASPNSIVDAGEGARITLSLFASINGTSAIGQTTAYTPPPPPGTGTMRGIASFRYDMHSVGGGQGNWLFSTASGVFVPTTPSILEGGATLAGLGSSQNVSPGGTASSVNPINNAFRGVWTPSSYTPRLVTFTASNNSVDPGGSNAWLVQYGNDPGTGDPQYLVKFVAGAYGTGAAIPIAPAPSGVLVLGALGLLRRRR